ncbi:MAG: PaaI family thioesterase [Hyphomicrobiales bacterium]|nr:PaaI family thioesterase [Hyphomicrobiales bacterium]MCP5373582.1 PaaI family thioesterase [Hyphomicrobiales bacterium]
MEHEVPEGFIPFPPRSGFVDQSGPYYFHAGADPFLARDGAPVTFGFLTDQRHVNPAGMVHGGALLTFADTVMGATVFHTVGRNCATITLNSEFVSAALPGRWIEAKVTLTRITRTLAFVKSELRSGEHILLNASGVWKVFEATARERPGPAV